MSENENSSQQILDKDKAEAQKSLGNDSFTAKKYDEAIDHYTLAISFDPDNAVYYSNRSACYLGKSMWEDAAKDASLCITKDPNFVKGYYRLAVALTELKKYDEAIATIQAALQKESDNQLLVKQLKIVKAKKSASASSSTTLPVKKNIAKQLDDQQKKELYELQEQSNAYSKDLRVVLAKIASCERETRLNQITTSNISTVSPDVPLYKAVGKAFLSYDKAGIETYLETEHDALIRTHRDLLDRKEYLERRIASNQNNMNELIA